MTRLPRLLVAIAARRGRDRRRVRPRRDAAVASAPAASTPASRAGSAGPDRLPDAAGPQPMAGGETRVVTIETVEGPDRDHRRGRPRAARGRELRRARRVRLLRRGRVPSRHPGLRRPGRRPDRDGQRRTGLRVRGRPGDRVVRARRRRDGERRSGHERQPVLHRPRRRGRRRPRTRCTPSSGG